MLIQIQMRLHPSNAAELKTQHGAQGVLSPEAHNGVNLLEQIYERRNNLRRTSFHNLMGHIITLILDLLTHSTVPSRFTWHDCTQQREKCWTALMASTCLVHPQPVASQFALFFFFFERAPPVHGSHSHSDRQASALGIAESTYVAAWAV